jgi:hypothetical protein
MWYCFDDSSVEGRGARDESRALAIARTLANCGQSFFFVTLHIPIELVASALLPRPSPLVSRPCRLVPCPWKIA